MQLGVRFTTLMNWELKQREPTPRFMPAVMRFRGYDPANVPPESLSARIRSGRRRLGFTQHEFAGWLGVTYTTVNRWERGHQRPAGERLQRLHDVLTLEGNVTPARHMTRQPVRNASVTHAREGK
jgi:DNA-binding transcriptional regulator YiaG